MTVKAISLTDPAFEFAALATKLSQHRPDDPTAVYSVVADFIGVDESFPQLYELIGYIGSRSVSLINFIGGLKDEYLDEELRENLLASVYGITQIISPRHFASRWDEISRKHLISHRILLLRQFSQTARRYRPLRLVTTEEKDALLVDIDAAIEEAAVAGDALEWTSSLVIDGLRRLKTMIVYFDFFGHEAVLDHLLKINSEIEAASQSLGDAAREYAGKYFKAAGVIATAISIFLAPIKAHEAYTGYRGYMIKLSENPPALLAGPLKQLTGPATTRAERTDQELPPFTGP